MPGQMLMLENAHAYGVTVFAVNKELMDQFTFHHKAQLTVDMNRFFVLFVDDKVKLVEIQDVKPVIHRQLCRSRRKTFPWCSGEIMI